MLPFIYYLYISNKNHIAMKNNILLMILAALGFAGCGATSCQVDMYGVPRSYDGQLKGKVTDKSGNPIKGIEVTSMGKKATTATDGSYDIKGETYGDAVPIRFLDIDGPENGGEFAERVVKIELTADDWVGSSFIKTDADVTLEEKE